MKNQPITFPEEEVSVTFDLPEALHVRLVLLAQTKRIRARVNSRLSDEQRAQDETSWELLKTAGLKIEQALERKGYPFREH